jgi:hypothetical protein
MGAILCDASELLGAARIGQFEHRFEQPFVVIRVDEAPRATNEVGRAAHGRADAGETGGAGFDIRDRRRLVTGREHKASSDAEKIIHPGSMFCDVEPKRPVAADTVDLEVWVVSDQI